MYVTDTLLQSLCFRIQKMMEVYKPDWCETREEWSVYLFSPQNKWVDSFSKSYWKLPLKNKENVLPGTSGWGNAVHITWGRESLVGALMQKTIHLWCSFP